MEKNQIPGRYTVDTPYEVFDTIIRGMKKIDQMEIALQQLKVVKQTEWYTLEEFLAKTKVSRWKFDSWRELGLIQTKKLSRKWYVHPEEVTRYFNGELK